MNNRFVAPTITIVALVIFSLRPQVNWLKDSTDTVGLVLLAVALIPWLGSFVESWDIPGFGKAKFRQLEKRVEDAEKAAVEAKEAADDAEDLFLSPSKIIETSASADVPLKRLRELAEKYVSTRKAMKSGSERTTNMTSIMRQMMAEARDVKGSSYDLGKELSSDDPGDALAAIAYSYVFPEKVEIGDLIDAIKRTNHPFVQYWGLRSTHNVISGVDVGAFSIGDVAELRNMKSAFKSGTDRHFLIRRINHDLDRFVAAEPS